MGAKLGLENVGESENRRRAGGRPPPASAAPRSRRASARPGSCKGATPTTRSIGSRITQDRPTPKARAISSPSHKKTTEGNRASSAIPGAESPDSETTAKKAARPSSSQAPVGCERRQRSLSPGIGDRAEESQHDMSAGKGIERKTMAARIEEKGAVAPLGAGLERKVE